jgi:putative transposase
VKPARCRELVCRAKLNYGASIRVACEVLSISTTCYFYKPTLVDENAAIEGWLKRLTITHNGLCFDFLRNAKGFKWNHKRVYRIYGELEPNLRFKPKSRIM